MSDPQKLRDMAEMLDRNDWEPQADELLYIADNYAQLADECNRLRDDNKVLERQVEMLQDERERTERRYGIWA